MEKFIPYAKRRGAWIIDPVTRKPANSKAYSRSKAQEWRDDDSVSVPCLFAKHPLLA